ncbi:MAG TPA: aspartate--tRNA ligase [Thermotogota bacterium]|nr:aspartate--tRNA ligase [Thermotogota bacterium]
MREVEALQNRTHTCGELGRKDESKEAILSGWVDQKRNLGGILFVRLRDRYGFTQVVFSPESPELYQQASELHKEDVVQVKGVVRLRPQEAQKADSSTDCIELEAMELQVLSRAKTPPIYTNIEAGTSENMRLKYRYLDLRTARMQANLLLRSKVVRAVRSYFEENQFLDIETPVLTKSTPEGARDFLVPSRLRPGHFYALPQSPQLFKQLLMVSGFDRYYQVVKCFRDEDLRADRQPEFTQIDYELSFADEETVMHYTEGMLARVFQEALGVEIPTPFPRMDYATAMSLYGSDKPDLRFGLSFQDVSAPFAESDFEMMRELIATGGVVKGILLPGAASRLSRKKLAELESFARAQGAGGLLHVKWQENSWKASFSKFFSAEKVAQLMQEMKAGPEDGAVFVAGAPKLVHAVLGALRLECARWLELVPTDRFCFTWVKDFPMFEYSEEEGRFVAQHHPFTMPFEEDLQAFRNGDLSKIRSHAYDVVLNGWELGGGSVRIHRDDLQEEVFSLLSLSPEDQRQKFGFLLEAFAYGVPPHAGCALGLDRLVALMAGEEGIRDVIAFPKTTSGSCLMTDAPSSVNPEQLDKLFLQPKQPSFSKEEDR